MPDIELTNIFKITYEEISDPHESRKLIPLTTEVSNRFICRTETCRAKQMKWDHMIIIQMCQVISGSVQTKQERKKANTVLTKKVHNGLSDVFTVIGWFEGTLSLQTKG